MTSGIEVSGELKNAIDEALQQRGIVNILVAGKPGVGKSTLVNAVFQGNFAETGQGMPVTKETRKITKSGVPVSIYDTRGLELAKFDSIMNDLQTTIHDINRSEDANEHIHAAWMCISEDSRRVEDAELQFVSLLARDIPVVVVITKAQADDGFSAEVQRLIPEARNVVRVRALRQVYDDGHTIRALNLDTLVSVTMEVVPEGQRFALAAAQKISIEMKAQQARRVIAMSATAAIAVGATPIPFSDMFLLAPIQIKMLASISAVFGFNVTEAFFTGGLLNGAK